MTVAEQIKRSTKTCTIDRWFIAFNRAFIKNSKLYMRSGGYSRDYWQVGVWDFVFVDGSQLTVRLYW